MYVKKIVFESDGKNSMSDFKITKPDGTVCLVTDIISITDTHCTGSIDGDIRVTATGLNPFSSYNIKECFAVGGEGYRTADNSPCNIIIEFSYGVDVKSISWRQVSTTGALASEYRIKIYSDGDNLIKEETIQKHAGTIKTVDVDEFKVMLAVYDGKYYFLPNKLRKTVKNIKIAVLGSTHTNGIQWTMNKLKFYTPEGEAVVENIASNSETEAVFTINGINGEVRINSVVAKFPIKEIFNTVNTKYAKSNNVGFKNGIEFNFDSPLEITKIEWNSYTASSNGSIKNCNVYFDNILAYEMRGITAALKTIEINS